MADVTAQITELKTAIEEFEVQYTKYSEQGVNSAGSRARKSLMAAKKNINALRKTILEEQKEKKAERKAAKESSKTDSDTAKAKKGKKGKKGKSTPIATEEATATEE